MWSRSYQHILGAGETLARQELSGVKCGFRNERKGKVIVEVIVHYDPYDDERGEDAAYTLEAHTYKAFNDAMKHGMGVMIAGGGGGAGYLPNNCNGAIGGAINVPTGGAGGFAGNCQKQPEEETFAARYERAMKIVNP